MSDAMLPLESQSRFLELLPWYVNGTLRDDDCRKMERWLAADADCRADLAWMQNLQRQVRSESVSAMQAAQVNEHAGLDRLMTMVRAEQAGKLTHLPTRQAAKTSPRTGFQRWYKPVMAMAATLAVVQVGILFLHMSEFEKSDTLRPLGSTAPTSPVARQVMIQATFRADTSDAQIRGLLSKAGVEIVSGPGALGVYTLKVPTDRADAALAELRHATRIIDSVTVLSR